MDHDGRTRVTGHITDIVIRGVENISAREMEELLADQPGVAAVGHLDARLGERCCAVVVPVVASRSVGTCRPLLLLRHRGIAKYKLSERPHLFDAFRITTTGKVKKAELRALVARPRQAARQRGTGASNGGYGIP
jgi:non-ribosomal peptide synthetase component E (peptide arylation enzyme)